MNRAAIAGVIGIVMAGAGAWWLSRGEPSPPSVAGLEKSPPAVGLDEPLPMDETVELRWVDEETGAEDVWKVTKRETSPEDRATGPSLPEPDPDAGNHEPDESARTLYAMGLESWKRGEIRDAMSQLRDAIEVDPDDPLPRTQYGRLQVLAMEYNEALPHLERAAALRPDDPQVWLDLTTLYEKALILDRSWEARRRAEELVGDRPIYQDELSGFYMVEGTIIHP